jgi:hypothetical protein
MRLGQNPDIETLVLETSQCTTERRVKDKDPDHVRAFLCWDEV